MCHAEEVLDKGKCCSYFLVGGHRSRNMGVKFCIGGGLGMESVKEEEGRMLGCRVLVVVAGKLNKRKEQVPVVLLVVHIEAKHLLEGLVNSLCLTICLGVEGSG